MKSEQRGAALWSAVLLAVIIISSNVATAFGQGGVPVPSPPTDLRDRFGIYNWGMDYTSARLPGNTRPPIRRGR